MASRNLTLTNFDSSVVFYHENDERAFFAWLERIDCVDRIAAEPGSGLVVHLRRRPRKADLLELLALGCRYGVDMRQFAKFEAARNRHWFADPGTYWHKQVFGPLGPHAG